MKSQKQLPVNVFMHERIQLFLLLARLYIYIYRHGWGILLECVMFNMQMLIEQTKTEMSYSLCAGYQTANMLLPQVNQECNSFFKHRLGFFTTETETLINLYILLIYIWRCEVASKPWLLRKSVKYLNNSTSLWLLVSEGIASRYGIKSQVGR